MSYPANQILRNIKKTPDDKLQIVSMTLRSGEEIIVGQRLRQLLTQARRQGFPHEIAGHLFFLGHRSCGLHGKRMSHRLPYAMFISGL